MMDNGEDIHGLLNGIHAFHQCVHQATHQFKLTLINISFAATVGLVSWTARYRSLLVKRSSVSKLLMMTAERVKSRLEEGCSDKDVLQHFVSILIWV